MEETYILTPRRGEQSEHLYEPDYLEKYKMGAFEFISNKTLLTEVEEINIIYKI